jgi:hypothetical protein
MTLSTLCAEDGAENLEFQQMKLLLYGVYGTFSILIVLRTQDTAEP